MFKRSLKGAIAASARSLLLISLLLINVLIRSNRNKSPSDLFDRHSTGELLAGSKSELLLQLKDLFADVIGKKGGQL